MTTTNNIMSKPRFARLIAASQLFRDLSPDQTDAVLARGYLRRYRAGQTVAQQDDPPDFMFVVLEGQLTMLRANEDGDEVILRLLKEGDAGLAAAIFMGGLSPVSIRTASQAQLLQMPRSFVKQLVLDQPQFASNMLAITSCNYREVMMQIDAVVLRTPLQRIGHYLLREHVEQGSDSLTFNLKFRKAAIARHLGMTPETLSRAFRKIRKMGIEIEGQKVQMKDAFALCHFCDLDIRESCQRAGDGGCPHCHF